MVIPPEQEKLTPEENIFDLIDLIQSKISSDEYLKLMKTAQQLVQKIKDSEPEEEEMSVISDSSSTDGYQNPMSDSSSDDDEIEETSYTQCDCASKFAYPGDFPRNENYQTYHYMFCRGIGIFECENFKRLREEYPLLHNLTEVQNMPFANRETYAPYDLHKVNMIFSIFISLSDMFAFKRHKIIITLILYDFAMKNIKYIEDDRDSFGRVAYDKFIFFMYEPEFLEIAEEFNIDLDNWRLALERAIATPDAN
jgi:hypothetical protein